MASSTREWAGTPLMQACTIVARNYLAQARVLACSYQRWHPGERLAVLLLDDVDEAITLDDDAIEVIRPRDVGISDLDFHQMAAIYRLTELATAVKPWLLRALLRRGASAVVYLDPDIEVYADLAYLGPLAQEQVMLLTPHLGAPLPRDGREPREENFLHAGVFNLGFIAVSERARPFLDWWADRLRWDCLDAVDRGLFVDQRWVDLAVGIFPHAIFDDVSVNVAYWNLHERRIARAGDAFVVNGEPLRAFHFTGFDPANPTRLTRHLPPGSRVEDVTTPALVDLCRQYADHLMRHDYAACSATSYAFDQAGSVTWEPQLRRAYRDALLTGDPDCPDDPFASNQRDALATWATGARRRLVRARVRRALRRG
ncbi:MAG TPA: hypothetical protein VFB78_11435 [Acidimicrobiales bacterium]|nr:hypothetical protein [Acidimicrobiales bacterium]